MKHYKASQMGMHAYQPILDSLSLLNERLLNTYDVTSRNRASKRLRKAIKL